MSWLELYRRAELLMYMYWYGKYSLRFAQNRRLMKMHILLLDIILTVVFTTVLYLFTQTL